MNTEILIVPALLLADDNPALLATLVEMLKTRYRVVAALPSGNSVLGDIDMLRPDLLILDISRRSDWFRGSEAPKREWLPCKDHFSDGT